MKSRSLLVVCALVLLVIIPRSGFSQAGIYWSAQVMEEKQLAVGTDLVLGSFPSFAWVAHARYGMAEGIDISPKIGFSRDSKVTMFVFGADFRYGVMQESMGDDVDLTLAGVFDVWTGSSTTILTIGFGPQLGRTFPMEGSDALLSPYAGILLGVSRFSRLGASKSDFGGILPIGNQFQFRDNLAAHFELDLMFGNSTELQVGLGIDYLY